jgi:hypothetical protein
LADHSLKVKLKKLNPDFKLLNRETVKNLLENSKLAAWHALDVLGDAWVVQQASIRASLVRRLIVQVVLRLPDGRPFLRTHPLGSPGRLFGLLLHRPRLSLSHVVAYLARACFPPLPQPLE